MKLKRWMASAFFVLFMSLAVVLAGLAVYQFAANIWHGDEFITGVIRALNSAFISLAVFELAIGIQKEYSWEGDEGEQNIYLAVRRTVTRFVSVVAIALVLEGLIMIIKYSQLDLAGNLYYPVAIVISAGVLLGSLGGFLTLTRKDC